MGLRTKFNLTLLVICLGGLALTGAVSYQLVQQNAREEVIRNAQIMRESAQAIRDYTAQEIRPLLASQSNNQFLPHTVPSFAAQTNFRALQESFPAFRYKEAALNPTNPSDLANEWETRLIEAFRKDDGIPELIRTLDTADGQILTLSRPIKITMKCRAMFKIRKSTMKTATMALMTIVKVRSARSSGTCMGTDTIWAPMISFICQPNPFSVP